MRHVAAAVSFAPRGRYKAMAEKLRALAGGGKEASVLEASWPEDVPVDTSVLLDEPAIP